MNKEGTLVVLAFVAKQDKLFKASDVFTETGLERPLVYYHLKRFTSLGYIEKVGPNYCVLDREKLIEALAYGKEHRKSHEAKDTAIFKNGKELTRTIELCVQARSMVLPGSRDLKEVLNQELDLTIQTLKDAKRGLNTRQVKPHKAKAKFAKQDSLSAYITRLEYFGIEVDKEMIELAYENEFIALKQVLIEDEQDAETRG